MSQERHTNLRRELSERNADWERKVAPPVVRVLRKGTLDESRDWRVSVTGVASGQIKVPLVVWGEEIRNWLAVQVVQES